MPEWDRVRLGEVLREVSRPERVQADKRYKLLGTRWYAGGLFIKDEKLGSAIQANTLYRVEEGDFVYNRLFAWKGSFAIATNEHQGCYASNEFPCFKVDEERLEVQYLYYYFMQPDSWTEALGLSSGSTPTSRNRLKEEKLLDMVIPLPPLPEQRRIVARVKGMLAKVEEARKVREQTQTQLHDLIAAEERKIWPEEALAEAPLLEEVTDFLSRGRQSAQGESQHRLIKTQHVQMGQYVPTQARLSPEVAGKVKPEALVRQGDTLIACSAAGCLGRVAFYDDDSGIEASTDTHVAIARPNLDRVTPEYLYAYLKGAQGQYQLRSRERGDWQREKVGFRLIELNVADMRRIPIPTPSLARQHEIVATLDSLRSRVNAVTASQAQTQRELDALPASILARAFAGAL